MHLSDPIAEAVQNHPADNRMIGVKRVARAAVVGKARAVLLEDVVGVVVKSAEAERWPGMVAFGRVVEDDVQDHFDACAVQRLDHVAELVDRAERDPAVSCSRDAAQRTRPVNSPNS